VEKVGAEVDPVKVLTELAEVAAWCGCYRAAGLSVGLVPTMGALHGGHLSLIERAREECDRVVASIFVNPTQFGPGEDLAAYPRPLAADLDACRRGRVDVVLSARADDVYPPGFQTWVTVEEVARPLCGERRPIHFRGVATVVTQLLSATRPHRAYFGQKDYQQSVVVRRLSADLHLGVEIRVLPTVREPDGLAMSSRNAYLSPLERAAAPGIFRALCEARDRLRGGARPVADVLAGARRAIEALGHDFRVDYLELRDAATLAELDAETRRGARLGARPGIDGRAPIQVVLAAAVFAGRARLIDNVLFEL
jgi:pantoate--beta-alanine ligase